MVWIIVRVRIRICISCIPAIKNFFLHENYNRVLFEMAPAVTDGSDRFRNAKLRRFKRSPMNASLKVKTGTSQVVLTRKSVWPRFFQILIIMEY